MLIVTVSLAIPAFLWCQSSATAEPVGHLSPGFVSPPIIAPQVADRLAKHLGLDAAKTSLIKKIQGDLSVDLEKMKIGLERKMLDFRELMLSANLDMDKIKKNCEERGRLMAEMQFRMVVSDNEVKKLLTPEQWTQYMQFRIQTMNRVAAPRGDGGKVEGGKAPDGKGN